VRHSLTSILLLLTFLNPGHSQVDGFARIGGTAPDFGGMSGTWGHYQFYRPFGVQGVPVTDWRDLTGLSPLTGEVLNTDRQGWQPLFEAEGLWDQLHPSLTTDADTTAPSTMVNYRQGDGIFKDFSLWYHNSLDQQIRFGYAGKLRSHPRIIEATVYDEQRHRVQIQSLQDGHKLVLEASYDHQINPLYLLSQNDQQLWIYDDGAQIRSDRWEGSFEWNDLDSSGQGSELFLQAQAGTWIWESGERRSLNVLSYARHHREFLGQRTGNITLGLISRQFGGNKRTQPFAELRWSASNGERHHLELGLNKLGGLAFFPLLNLQVSPGIFRLGLESHQIIHERLWESEISQAQILELQGGLDLRQGGLRISTWQGRDDGQPIAGSSSQVYLHFPWEMSLKLGAAQLHQHQDWVFSRTQFNWELVQRAKLFRDALHARLRVWGQHYADTRPGLLDPVNFEITASPFAREDGLHLLNYTLSAQVSTVIISFTDQNMLHDQLWSQYAEIPWNLDFYIMANQIPNSRFRYVSIIWTFDN